METKFVNLNNGAALEIVRYLTTVTFRIRDLGSPWFELGALDRDGFHDQVQQQQRKVIREICNTLRLSPPHEVQLGVGPSLVNVYELSHGFRVFIGGQFIFDAHVNYSPSPIVSSSAITREAKALLQELGCEPDWPASQVDPSVPDVQTQLDMAHKVIGEKNRKIEELEGELATAQFELDAEKKKVALRDATIDELKKRIDGLTHVLSVAERDRSRAIDAIYTMVDKIQDA